MDNPTLRRLNIVVNQLTTFAQSSNTSKWARYAWVLQGMLEEVSAELDQEVPPNIGDWFEDFGKVIQWTGNGDETVLPESVKSFLIQHHPQEMRVAIEA